MTKTDYHGKDICSDEERAEMVVRIAEAAQAHTIICVTESGAFAKHFLGFKSQYRIIAATAIPETYNSLTEAGLVTLLLPLHAIDKHRQIRHVLSVALKSNNVSAGELVVCAMGQDVYPGEANLVVVMEVEPDLEELVITDLVKLTDGIRPKAFDFAVAIACKIGRAARRGKRIGAIFMLGDSLKVLEGSRQLIPNPFKGHEHADRTLMNLDIHEAIVELSKPDGAFVVRGDGFIQTAGVFLAAFEVDVELPGGLGARHAAAAAVTARTAATGVVVSATDGNVRVFSAGRMVLRMDPDIEHGPIHMDE
jgi:DNA integrity scanning protein DisA with diadenylate cyclase activity